MKEINEQIIIEQYLDGTLDKTTQKLVTQRIKDDVNFAKEVAIWQIMTDGLEGRIEDDEDIIINAKVEAAILANINDRLTQKGFYNEEKKWSQSFPLVGIGRWLVAATILISCSFAFFILRKETPSYYVLTKTVLFDANIRGKNSSTIEIKKLLYKAFEFYDKAAYEQSISMFKKAKDISNSDALDSLTRKYYYPRISVYLSCAYLFNKQAEMAIDCLKLIYEEEPIIPDVKREVMWYLAMAYLDNKQEKEAIQFLKKLQEDKIYKNAANQKLNVLSK